MLRGWTTGLQPSGTLPGVIGINAQGQIVDMGTGQIITDAQSGYIDDFGGTLEEQQTVQQLAQAGYDTSIKSARALTQAINNSATGVISVPKSSSAYVIAMQNAGFLGSFTVAPDPLNPGMYLISAGSLGGSGLALGGGVGIAVAALVLVLVMSRR